MEIFLASSNEHKKHEMEELFKDYTIITPKDINLNFDPIEDGKSFVENSLIKAKALYEIVKKPVLADDSGICVDALDGKPGIYSARYCGRLKNKVDGHKLSQNEQNGLLIEDVNLTLKEKNLDPKKRENRSCRYVCSLILYYGKDQFLCSQETLEGILLDDINESRGTTGFGYDPIIFLPEFGKTVAELTEEEKNSISHRGKAAELIAKAMKNLF
ncbi:MAG: RdgB/HAM1 family non-canonical purine NTP pyrophosphatase [Treponemataceae bacterium]|nr:RdgB/HAM1 family non-canonical purine NTP pyrophosphatase [Spirochaetales bacterium]MDY6030172.1 RdgB/HAM1 family non-canonical purine NTP pyrophosphatase [Treponemataceae bacterium]